MRCNKRAFIVWDKSKKCFYMDDGSRVEAMDEAFQFETESVANLWVERCDEPENLEIWQIEIVMYTK